MKRVCGTCEQYLPPKTKHFVIDNMEYCVECVEVRPYTAYQYYILDGYVGDSETGEVERVESYEDLYEEENHKKSLD